MNKQQLNEIAKKSYFPRYEKVSEIIATSDGNFFLPSNRQQAVKHAEANKLELYVIAKEEKKPINPSTHKPLPKGNPTTSWTVEQIKAFAEKHEITLEGDVKKDMVAKIEKTLNPSTHEPINKEKS